MGTRGNLLVLPLGLTLSLWGCMGPPAPNTAPTAPVVSLAPANAKTTDDLRAVIVTPSIDAEGDAVTYAYVWLKNGTPVPDATGDTVLAAKTGKGETWAVRVTPSDGKATGEAGTAHVSIGNTLPSASLTLEPATPVAGTPLKAAVVTTDADDDVVRLAFTWTKDGMATAFVDDTIPGAQLKRGEVWKVTVTPSDGETGASVTASATVANTAPVVASVSLSPAVPNKTTTLTATPAAAIDADGDPTTVAFAWTVNGVVVAGQVSATLSPQHFNKGDVVGVSVVANDGFSDSAPATATASISNSAPAITGVAISPSSGGKAATFTCTPTGWTDADGDAEGYAWEWQADGQVVSTTATLSGAQLTKGQAITCKATPTDGTASGAPMTSATMTVANTPPTVSSVVITPAAPKKSDTISATPAGWADLDGDAEGYQYRWRANGTLIANATAATLPGTAFSKGQVITLELIPFDGTATGTPVTSNTVTVANSVPVLAGVTLAPAQPTEATPIVATPGAVTDADQDATTLRYQWTVGGTVVAGQTTSSLGPQYFAKDDVVSVSVVPNDGASDGLAATASVTVRNSAPSITGVSISPSTGGRGATFTCTPAGWSDLDGDTASYLYEWKANGTVVGTSATLSGNLLVKDQSVTCKATPTDGVANGTALTSAAVTVSNTAPSVASVSISPLTPRKSDTITATPAGWADVDNDSEGYQYRWKSNGAVITGATSASLSGAYFAKGQSISLELVPFDGTTAGTPVTSNAVTVANSPPVLSSVTLSPSQATEAGPIIATAGAVSDADQDAATLKYQWTVNGVLVTGQTTASLGTPYFAKGDVVRVSVVPNDGTDDGVAVTASVTVINSAPSITGVAITPSTGGRGTTFACSATGWTDLDGDAASYIYEWKANGSVVGTSSSLSGALLSKGQIITCKVTPTDGQASGSPLTSSGVTIVNTAPSLASVSLGPVNPRKTDTVTATPVGWADLDNDPAAYQYVWKRNGVVIAGQTSSTLPGSQFSKGQVITAEVRPFDGTAYGTTVVSNAVTVVNSPPSMTSVSVAALGGGTPMRGVALTATSSGVTDVDGDTVSLLHAWSVNGVIVTGVVGNLLTGTNFSKGQSVQVVVTPDDGSLQGTAVTSNSVTIQNAPPTTPGISMVPLTPGDADDLVCSVTTLSTDADADAISYVFTWTKNGAAFGGASATSATSSTISSGSTANGDTFACTVTATDGTANSTANPVSVTVGLPLNCKDLLTRASGTTNGVYLVDPDGSGPVAAVNVYCDMTAGGWTLVANIYDSAGDDAPNDTAYVVSGWQQLASGSWATSATTIDRVSTGVGSAAVSLAFVAALKATGNQQNFKMCFVHQDGTDNTCRSSADGSFTMASYSTGNPKLMPYTSNSLVYTFGRMAGLGGSRDGYDYSLYANVTYDPATGFGFTKTAGLRSEWGYDWGVVEYPSYLSVNYFGVWHGGGEGISYRPNLTDFNELGNGYGVNPTINTYGFRLYIGP